MHTRKKHQKRRLGQHFLIDSAVCETIVASALIKADEHVIEIGPGLGALTRTLAIRSGAMTLIEADEKLAGKLREEYPEMEIMNARAEHIDFSVEKGPIVVVSNLPYYASVHIYKHLVKYKKHISRMVLMFQKEVADRISAAPGHRHYGSLSLFSRYHFHIEKILDVPPSAFAPPPKVYSTVLRFVPHAVPPVACGEEDLFKVIRAAFVQKRRTLFNNLKNLYTYDSLENAVKEAGLGEKIRAEAVTLEQFAVMSEFLIPIDKGNGSPADDLG